MPATPLVLCSLALCSASSETPAGSIPKVLPPDPLRTVGEETISHEKFYLQKAQDVSWRPYLAEDSTDMTAGPQWSERRILDQDYPIVQGLTINLSDGPQAIAPEIEPRQALSIPIRPKLNRQKPSRKVSQHRHIPQVIAIATPDDALAPSAPPHSQHPALEALIGLSPEFSPANKDASPQLGLAHPTFNAAETEMGPNQPDGQRPILEPAIELTQTFSEPTDDDFLKPDLEDKPLNPEDVESELGEIRIIQPQWAQPRPRRRPSAQLLLRSAAFTSSNITGLEAIQESDNLLTNSASVLVTPKLGPETTLVAAAGYGLTRFPDEGDSNYDFLNLSVGVQQQLNRATYAQLGWVQRQLYSEDSGARLLLDNSLRFIIGRQDQLADKLRLDSFYELRARFTDPNDRNRLGNTLGARLRYDITPQLSSFLGYQLRLDDFTRVARFDARHQIRAATTYSVNRTVFVGGSLSYLFGSSSDSAIDLENFSAGLSLGVNIPFF